MLLIASGHQWLLMNALGRIYAVQSDAHAFNSTKYEFPQVGKMARAFHRCMLLMDGPDGSQS